MSIQQTMTRSFGRAILQSKKNSPHIFFGFGLVSVVGGSIMACRATLKLEKVVDDIQAEFAQINDMKEKADKGTISYDRDEYMRDLTFAYIRTMKKLGALYGPSVVVGGIGVACLTGSHVQLTRRNAAVTAAFAAVTKAYDEYRRRVREEFGEEKELAIYQACLLDEDEDMRAPKKMPLSKNAASPYSRYFEPTNVNWKPEPEWNRIYIQAIQNQYNHVLQSRGHVFLNEIYDDLGFEHTPEGAVVGWLLGGNGDNHIDFSIFTPINANFVNGDGTGCLLDFNVDGVIYDQI